MSMRLSLNFQWQQLMQHTKFATSSMTLSFIRCHQNDSSLYFRGAVALSRKSFKSCVLAMKEAVNIDIMAKQAPESYMNVLQVNTCHQLSICTGLAASPRGKIMYFTV